MRIVLDSNILARANPLAAADALARDLVRAAAYPPNFLILSVPILIEIARVLRYPHVQKRWPLSEEEIQEYLSTLADAGFLVGMPSHIPAIVSDPDDDPILQTAIAGHADVLCSRDHAFRAARVEQICAAHGIRVLDDVSLMRELRG